MMTYPELNTAIEELVKRSGVDDYEAVQNIYEDLINWDSWIEDPEPVHVAGSAELDAPENTALLAGIRGLVADEGLDDAEAEAKLVGVLFNHTLYWEDWYWDRAADENDAEYAFLAEVHAGTYGRDYGDTWGGVYDGSDAPNG